MTSEIANITGCNPTTLCKWKERGKLKGYRRWRDENNRVNVIWHKDNIDRILMIRMGNIEKKRDEVSKLWMENPPPGAHDWDDDLWLLKIDEHILGRNGAKYISERNEEIERSEISDS